MTTVSDSLAINLRDVAKRYRGRVDALRGIEMQVHRGEIFGLLGPNGAGKSTLVKIIMTIIRATRGEGTVLDRPIGHKPTLARIGYLPENHRFPRYLTGLEAVEFFGALANVDRATRRRRAAELIELVGMKDAAQRKIGTYSKGMAQRIGLAQSLINDPDLVLLDEPTDGVDPLGRRDIRDVLVHLRARKKTVFINSHLLSELEMICDRVAILVSGAVARQGTIAELTEARQRYEIDVPLDVGSARPLHEVLGVAVQPFTLPAPPGSATPMPGMGPPMPRIVKRGMLATGLAIEFEQSTLRITTADPQAIQPTLDALRSAGLTIVRVQLVRPSLEELFMEAIGANGGRP